MCVEGMTDVTSSSGGHPLICGKICCRDVQPGCYVGSSMHEWIVLCLLSTLYLSETLMQRLTRTLILTLSTSVTSLSLHSSRKTLSSVFTSEFFSSCRSGQMWPRRSLVRSGKRGVRWSEGSSVCVMPTSLWLIWTPASTRPRRVSDESPALLL